MFSDDWTSLFLRLSAAAVFGALIGIERQWRGHEAGLRTHAIVALSAATITLSSLLLFDAVERRGGSADPLRGIQGLAQAIGFIAGGLIFVRGGGVRNMTTAVSLWMAAAAGIAAGAGQWRLLIAASVLTVLLLCLDRLLEHRSAAMTEESGKTSMPNRRGNTS